MLPVSAGKSMGSTGCTKIMGKVPTKPIAGTVGEVGVVDGGEVEGWCMVWRRVRRVGRVGRWVLDADEQM